MDVSIDRYSERELVPWGNGAGMAHFPWGEALPKEVVLAFATIENRKCDFSIFPGKMRHFTLVQGRCRLLVNTTSKHPQSIELEGKYPSCFFDASVPTTCTLIGEKALAFNLIYELGHGRVQADVIDARNSSRCFQENSDLCAEIAQKAKRSLTFVLCLSGSTKVEPEGGNPIALEALDLLRFDSDAPHEALRLRFSRGAELLVSQVVL